MWYKNISSCKKFWLYKSIEENRNTIFFCICNMKSHISTMPGVNKSDKSLQEMFFPVFCIPYFFYLLGLLYFKFLLFASLWKYDNKSGSSLFIKKEFQIFFKVIQIGHFSQNMEQALVERSLYTKTKLCAMRQMPCTKLKRDSHKIWDSFFQSWYKAWKKSM